MILRIRRVLRHGSNSPNNPIGRLTRTRLCRRLVPDGAYRLPPARCAPSWLHEGRGGSSDSTAAKAYYERAAALGDEDAKKALERAKCPYVIKDKRGNVVTNMCF